jgi:hypothetical protein
MKTKTLVEKCLIVASILLLLTGCGVGSYQARSVDTVNSPLVNPSIFKEGSGDQALYRYVKPNLNIKQYSNIIVDPVMVQKDGELDKDELANYQTLANNAYVYLTQELGKDYHIVKIPEPNTLRVQLAIIDADSSKPVRNTLSTILPIGIAVSVIKYGATGKQSGVGEITTEMKITDANTGELLGAALDRRVGGKELSKLWSSWDNADDALQYWAKRLSFALCDMRGGANCVAP